MGIIIDMLLPTVIIIIIPHNARPAFARILSAAIKAVATDNFVDSWLKLFMLPKCVLPSSKRRSRHNKPVSINLLCDLWSKGHFGELCVAQGSINKSHHPSGNSVSKKHVDSAISLAQDGLYGKACQV